MNQLTSLLCSHACLFRATNCSTSLSEAYTVPSRMVGDGHVGKHENRDALYVPDRNQIVRFLRTYLLWLQPDRKSNRS
jgi:hypothetical protein